MATLSLHAQPRTVVGKGVRVLRKTGVIPAVVYGRGFTSLSITLPEGAFHKLFRVAGETRILDLVVGTEAPRKVIIAHVEYHPVHGDITHVDFHQIRMDEKITTEVALKLVGIAPAVKELGGVLVTNLSEVKISCLPGDLISSIEVDMGSLKTFSDYIYVKDLQVPSTIKILENATEVVATVMAPRSEEELKALDEKPTLDVSAVERLEKPKKEGEEGEAAAPVAAETKPAAEKKK